VPNKYNKTGDLDIVDEIKICVWVPCKYNKTGDLDIVDEIKICDWVPNKYNKTGDFHIAKYPVTYLNFVNYI
jgi:hypothetical protein